jgi:O-antigen ligase
VLSSYFPSQHFPIGERNFKGAWNWAQLGLLLLPLVPALGTIVLFVTALNIGRNQFKLAIERPFNWGLIALSLWLAISSCFAVNRTDAFLGLANFLPFFILFATFSLLIQTPSQLRQLAWILVIPSPLIVILGMGQLFANWSMPNILGWQLVAGGIPPGRMASVFIYANFLAVYLTIVFILGLGLWIETYQAWQQNKKNQLLWMLLFLSVNELGNTIGIVGTSSRNAWGIACLACLVFALYLGWRKLAVSVTSFSTAILCASFGPDPLRYWLRQVIPAYFWARLSDEMYPDRPEAIKRSTQWQFSWELIQQRPWTGWGMRNFTSLYLDRMHEWLGHPHNLFLMMTVETGLPGTLSICAIVGWVMVRAVKLLAVCSSALSEKTSHLSSQDLFIFATYLLAFGSCILFNLFDVTIYDLRVNTIGWILLTSIYGVVERESKSKTL